MRIITLSIIFLLKGSVLTFLPDSTVNSSINQSTISFAKLQSFYLSPSVMNKEDLFKNVLRGGWPNLISDSNYTNTCAIRMSIALNAGGVKITKKYSDGNHKDGNGNYITVKVPTIKDFLAEKIGGSFWGMSKVAGEEFDFASHIPAGKGIILYTFKNGPANGHVDLWDGEKCLNNCPDVDTNDAATIEFWKLE